MERPHSGGTSFRIKVSSVPGKYALATVFRPIVAPKPFHNMGCMLIFSQTIQINLNSNFGYIKFFIAALLYWNTNIYFKPDTAIYTFLFIMITNYMRFCYILGQTL